MKGIPLRIEIGPKDVKKKQIIAVRRDTGKKESIKIKDVNKKIPVILDDIHKNLLRKSENMLKKNTLKVKNMSELIKAIKNKKLAVGEWCGSKECEDWIKTKTKAKIIGINEKAKARGKCIYCGKKAKHVVWIAKSY